MPDVLRVLLVATLTVLATGLGALPVLAAGEWAERLRPWLDGLVIGVMGVAAVIGLLLPAARDGSAPTVALGVALGAGGLWWARRALLRRLGAGDGMAAERRAQLTFGVLLVHSLPEGFALGSAMATPGRVAAFVVVAVAIQNIPEGTATAIAMLRAGRGPARQVEAAVVTSLPQIPGALIAWLAVEQINAVLALSLAAAGAAMLLLVAVDLIPTAARLPGVGRVVAGTVLGAGMMLGLAALLRVPI